MQASHKLLGENQAISPPHQMRVHVGIIPHDMNEPVPSEHCLNNNHTNVDDDDDTVSLTGSYTEDDNDDYHDSITTEDEDDENDDFDCYDDIASLSTLQSDDDDSSVGATFIFELENCCSSDNRDDYNHVHLDNSCHRDGADGDDPDWDDEGDNGSFVCCSTSSHISWDSDDDDHDSVCPSAVVDFDDDDASIGSTFAAGACGRPHFSREQRITKEKAVRFGTVEVREYALTVGDYPDAEDSCPVTLTWESNLTSTRYLEDHEEDKKAKKKQMTTTSFSELPARRMTLQERRRRVADTQGITDAKVCELELDMLVNRLQDLTKKDARRRQ